MCHSVFRSSFVNHSCFPDSRLDWFQRSGIDQNLIIDERLVLIVLVIRGFLGAGLSGMVHCLSLSALVMVYSVRVVGCSVLRCRYRNGRNSDSA